MLIALIPIEHHRVNSLSATPVCDNEKPGCYYS